MVSRAVPTRSLAVATLLAVVALPTASQEPGSAPGDEPQRPLTVARVDDSHLLVGGAFGLVLVDADGPPYRVLAHLDDVRVRSITPHADGYVYLNLDDGELTTDPLAVVRVEGEGLRHLFNQGEPAVRYEKMAVAEGLLLVAAHEHGVRVYSITDPANPVLVDTFEAGLWDAWAVAADGRRLWIADGADGLKTLDVGATRATRAASPERLGPPMAMAHDVCLRNGRIYVAAGSDGVAVLDATDAMAYTTLSIDGPITDLRWMGDRLAAASSDRVALLRPEPEGGLRVERTEPLLEQTPQRIQTRPDASLLSSVSSDAIRCRFLLDWNASRVTDPLEARPSANRSGASDRRSDQPRR